MDKHTDAHWFLSHARFDPTPRLLKVIVVMALVWVAFAVAVYGELNQCAVDLSASDWRPMPGEVEPPPPKPRKKRYVIVTTVRGVPLTLAGSL